MSNLEKVLQHDIPRAREVLMDILEEDIIVETEKSGDVYAILKIKPETVLKNDKVVNNQQLIKVVAGTGFEPMTFGL